MGGDMSTRTIVIVLVVLLLLGALPTWPYSAGWGYYPSGGLGLVLLVLLALLLMGRLYLAPRTNGRADQCPPGCSTQNARVA